MTPYVGPRTAKSRILVGAIQNGEVAASRREPEPMSPECGIGAEPVRQIGPPQMAAKGQLEPRPRRLRECDRRELERVIEPCPELPAARARTGSAWPSGFARVSRDPSFSFLRRVRGRPTGSWSIIVAGFSGEAKGALF